MIYAVSFKHQIPEDAIVIDVTSRSNTFAKYLSPFHVGPVNLYDKFWAYNIENAFQFSKVYEGFTDYEGNPSTDYWEWAKKGWATKLAIKYPINAWTKHLYHTWNYEKLTDLEAQNRIFIPLYSKAVVKTTAFQRLKEIYENSEKDIYLQDFEGYNHRFLELNWDQVMNNPNRPVGQGFVLCMLLEKYL